MASPLADFGQALFGQPPVSSQPYTTAATDAQGAARQYAGREQSDYNNQVRLGDSLWSTVNGTAGPSVAGLQLQNTLGQNLNTGLAMGAGTSGAGSVLARYLAAQQTGAANADAIRAGALLKAKETADARQQLGGLYSNMDASSSGLFGTNANLGFGYNQLANNVNQGNRTAATSAEAAGLSALSGIGSMIFSRPPSGGAPYSGVIGNDAEATSAMGW